MSDFFDPAPTEQPTYPREQAPQPSLFLPVVGMMIALAMVFIIVAELYQDRQSARMQAEAAAGNLSNAIARDIDRNISLYNFVLMSLRDTLTSPDFDKIPPDLHDAVLFAHTAVPKDMGVLFVTDAKGTVILDSTKGRLLGDSRGWRPYFRYHQDNADPKVLISGPFNGATTGDPVIVLSMRLNLPDGSFNGIVAASMQLSYFDGLLTDIRLMPGSSLTLLLNNEAVLARKPLAAGFQGHVVATPPVLGDRPTPMDSLRNISSATNGELVLSTGLEHWPLNLRLTLPQDGVYEQWRIKAWTISLTVLALLFGCTALIAQAHVEAVRRARAQSALTEANSRLEHMATTDALTGIANRRMFDDLMQREQARSTRRTHETAILMIDIDLFKSFNDTYGHGPGDATLRSVAQAVAQSVTRGGDLAARIGGEEFAVLLTDTDIRGALAVAERIQTMVAALGIRHSGSPFGHVTVSIGLAHSGDHPADMTLMQLMDMADEALYKGKRGGRNRVEIHRHAIAA